MYVFGGGFVVQYFVPFIFLFAIVSLGKRELVALLLLYFLCHVADLGIYLFLMVP